MKHYSSARREWRRKYRFYRMRRRSMVTNEIIGPELSAREIMAQPDIFGGGSGTMKFRRYSPFAPSCAECAPSPSKVIRVNHDGECIACGRQMRSSWPFEMSTARKAEAAVREARYKRWAEDARLFEIVPKRKPLGLRAWLARLLIRAARWLAPRDHGVLADSMEQAIIDAVTHGTGILKTERINPYDFSKSFDFLK
jgi:hypothetical protein